MNQNNTTGAQSISAFASELAGRLALKKATLAAFALSMATNVVLAATIAFADTKDRIVVLPAEPTKSFWLDNHAVSADYLEQMGVFVLQLALNNSPETFDYNTKKLLKYVTPDHRGETELRLVAQGRKLKTANSSINFLPQAVEVRPEEMRVAVQGSLRQFIGNKQTSARTKCWLVDFDYSGGRLWVEAIHEADCKKPFEALNEKKDIV